MNAREAFPGTGLREISPEDAAAIEDVANEIEAALGPDTSTAVHTDRGIFERSLKARRAEKARQQAIAAEAMGKVRALTASIHAMEAALDGLLLTEA